MTPHTRLAHFILVCTLSIVAVTTVAHAESKAYDIPKAGPGIEQAVPEAPTWCAQYKDEAKKKTPKGRVTFNLFRSIAVRMTWTITNEIQWLAWIACDAPDSPNRQKWVAYFRQKWMNTNGHTMAESRDLMAQAIAGKDIAPAMKKARLMLAWKRPDPPPSNKGAAAKHFVKLRTCKGDYSQLAKDFRTPEHMIRQLWSYWRQRGGGYDRGGDISHQMARWLALASCHKPDDRRRQANIGIILGELKERAKWSPEELRDVLEYYAATDYLEAAKQEETFCDQLRVSATATPWDNAVNVARNAVFRCRHKAKKQRRSRFAKPAAKAPNVAWGRTLGWWLDRPETRSSVLARLVFFSRSKKDRAILEALVMPDVDKTLAAELKALKVTPRMRITALHYVARVAKELPDARSAADAAARARVETFTGLYRSQRVAVDMLYACEAALWTKDAPKLRSCKSELHAAVAKTLKAIGPTKEGELYKAAKEPLTYAQLTLLAKVAAEVGDELSAGLYQQLVKHAQRRGVVWAKGGGVKAIKAAHWPGVRRSFEAMPRRPWAKGPASAGAIFSSGIKGVKKKGDALLVRMKKEVWYEDRYRCRSTGRIESVTRTSRNNYRVNYGQDCVVVGKKRMTKKVPSAHVSAALKPLLKKGYHLEFSNAATTASTPGAVRKIYKPVKAKKKGDLPDPTQNHVLYYFGFDLTPIK